MRQAIYKFESTEVHLVDNTCFHGFEIKWQVKNLGFGSFFYGWGVNLTKLKQYPDQQGFHIDTEDMEDQFIEDLLREVGPEMTRLLLKVRKI